MNDINVVIDIIKHCCKKISNIIKNSDSIELSTLSEQYNLSGDNAKKLDIIANSILKSELEKCELIRKIGSEEEEEIYNTPYVNAPYLICFDPLDGSSNIGVNITTGTIFALYKYNNNVITDGNNIILAGYCLYGGSTQLIIADKQVNMYQLKKTSNINNEKDFILISESMKVPHKGNYYAINESNKYIWHDKRNGIIGDKLINEGYSARWVASLVADAHRTIIKGGFFSYPTNNKNINGKIRLLYEAYPFAYIFKIAGAKSLNGKGNTPLLDVPFPENCHQKTPIILSSPYEMNLFLSI